jgi:hypothetical protein
MGGEVVYYLRHYSQFSHLSLTLPLSLTCVHSLAHSHATTRGSSCYPGMSEVLCVFGSVKRFSHLWKPPRAWLVGCRPTRVVDLQTTYTHTRARTRTHTRIHSRTQRKEERLGMSYHEPFHRDTQDPSGFWGTTTDYITTSEDDSDGDYLLSSGELPDVPPPSHTVGLGRYCKSHRCLSLARSLALSLLLSLSLSCSCTLVLFLLLLTSLSLSLSVLLSLPFPYFFLCVAVDLTYLCSVHLG